QIKLRLDAEIQPIALDAIGTANKDAVYATRESRRQSHRNGFVGINGRTEDLAVDHDVIRRGEPASPQREDIAGKGLGGFDGGEPGPRHQVVPRLRGELEEGHVAVIAV